MACYGVDLWQPPPASQAGGGTAPLPDPGTAPAENTNM
jgi:hypothetical protein